MVEGPNTVGSGDPQRFDRAAAHRHVRQFDPIVFIRLRSSGRVPSSASSPVLRLLGLIVVCGCLLTGASAIAAGGSADVTTSGATVANQPQETVDVNTLASVVTAESTTSGGSTAMAGRAIPSMTTLDGRIIELYPNPTTPQNHGEYVIVRLKTPGEWTLTDGHRTTQLPTRPGTYAVTRHPDKTAEHTDVERFEATGHIRFAVSGDSLELTRNGRVVDAVEYDSAPRSHRWRYDREPRWQPDGFVAREPVSVGPKPVESFVLPDSPDIPVEAVSGATDRLYLAAYTLTDRRVTDELLAAEARGVDVVVLVEGGPVGGMSVQQAEQLDELASGGVDVHVMTGDRTRFRYQHAKYAVVDDRVIVLTENWKPSGTGGADSRGWGVVVDSPKTAAEVAAVFDHDTTWHDTPQWTAVRDEINTFEQGHATGRYATEHPPITTTADSVTVVTAPDNAADELEQRIDTTDERLLIKQPSLTDTQFGLLQAAIRAADRGVSVKILLDSTWYVENENRDIADTLAERSAANDSPLEVRLVDGGDRFGKLHSKGIVADETAVIGSLNWNNNSATNNRELALIVDDREVADYYAGVFEADWAGDSDGDRDWPTGVIVVGLGVVAVATLLAKRQLEFEAV